MATFVTAFITAIFLSIPCSLDLLPTSCVHREVAIRLHIKPLLGRYKLQKLDRLTYEREFINKLEVKYKDSSVRQWHNVFKIAINAAVESEILIRNR
ncbi:hypothetical protein FQ087_06195 [Sporosarcina sp. ANT_H38]|nr:hypothetical protein FQ087_06195 [Sporosarcina sp. ANT_H38]